MKFTASFAVLAVFVSQAVVNAAPVQFDDALEARADFADGALEDVWSRFYDELLEEVEAREYDEDLFERAPMKKFAQDLGTGLAQKAPTYAKQYSQSQEAKSRNSAPRLANVAQQASHQSKHSSSGPKPLAASSKWNTVKKPSVMAEIKKLGKPSSIANQAKGGFRTRDLEFDEEVFERAPMKKFAQDLATGLGQKAPTYAKQYSQSEQGKARNSHPAPRLANVAQQAKQQSRPTSNLPKLPASSKWNTVKKPSVMAEIKKLGNPNSIANQAKGGFRTRDLEFDEEIFERAPMKKFAQDLATGLGQKAPTYAKQYSQSEQSKARNSHPAPRLANVAQQATQQRKPAGGSSLPKIPAASKWNTVKKPSVMAEIKKLRN